ncbi:MAG: hypothetical protein KGV44_13585 [Flavobacteriaceae bacterium]|nr:hypothetical protein [Flavobacteriaceae bacterium]
MKTNIKIVFLFIFSLCLLQVKAENNNEKISSQTKTFPATPISYIKIESKYGRIKVENWNKDKIEVTSHIRVASNNNETAEKILNNVNINTEHAGNFLDIKTEFGTFFTFIKFTNNLFRNGEFSIDYVIKMPKNIGTDITLDNGDIVLFERDANVKINHSKGNVSIETINKKAKIKLRGSNLKLNNSDSLLLDVRNTSLFIEKSNYIKTESYNTVYQIGKVNQLDANSMRDNFKIQELGGILVTSSLSDFKINSLSDECIAETNYGDFTVEHIGMRFDEIKMTSKGTKLALFLNSTPANIVINHHLSTKMSIPDGLGLNMKFTETPKYFITKGKVKNPKAGHTIRIKAKGGSLRLK